MKEIADTRSLKRFIAYCRTAIRRSKVLVEPRGWIFELAELTEFGAQYQPIFPAALLVREKAMQHSDFRISNARTLHRKELGVATLSNARIRGSIVLTEDYWLVEPASISFHEPPGLRRYQAVNSTVKLNGTVAYIATFDNEQAWAHWLLDVLPRVRLIELAGIAVADIDWWIIPQGAPKAIFDLFRKLGIAETKLRSISTEREILAERLVVPSCPNPHFDSFSRWFSNGRICNFANESWSLQWLRKEFGPNPDGNKDMHSRRIWISRSRSKTRRVENEIEVCKKLNLELVCLEQMSFREQVNLMAQAALVVGPHGSGLVNTLFCRPGTKIIELFEPHYVEPMVITIAEILDLEYSMVYGNGSVPASRRELLKEEFDPKRDVEIDANKLAELHKLVNENEIKSKMQIAGRLV